METPDRESQQRALDNIRFVARNLPKSVGSHHRSTLFEAANILEAVLTRLRNELTVAGLFDAASDAQD